jgi:outer membrane protein TolC
MNLFILSLALAAPASPALPVGADTLHLDTARRVAIENDARSGQSDLFDRQAALRIEALATRRLPEFSLGFNASWQSEVTQVSIPGIDSPGAPKDHLELAGNASLSLYDGGSVAIEQTLQRANATASQADLSVRMHSLRTEVDESFFNALLFQEQAGALRILTTDLGLRMGEIRSRVREGAALPADTAQILAELLTVEQRLDDLEAGRRAALGSLGRLLGDELAEGEVLALPALGAQVAALRNGSGEALRAHPQYASFEAQRQRIEVQERLARAGTSPRASAFASAAWGRPGLNFFNDEFHGYWTGGLRVQWAPPIWGANRREIEALGLQRAVLDTEETAFEAALARAVEQPLERIDALTRALATDDRIIALREQVARRATAQFDEGVVTPAGYLDAVTDLESARAAKVQHEVELARAQAVYLAVLGVEIR